jgi:hypothetical protein
MMKGVLRIALAVVLAGITVSGLLARGAQGGTRRVALGEREGLCYTDPYMVTLNPANEMNIIWLTKEPCNGVVEYGTTPQMGNFVNAIQYEIKGMRRSATAEGYDPDPEKNPALPVYQLIAKLGNLRPGTVVYYKTTTKKGSATQDSKRFFFKTAPERGTDFDFSLVSDMQLKVKTKETLYFLGMQHKDFIIFAGDLANTPWKAGEWFGVNGCYQIPGEEDRSFFEAFQQDDANCQLMQYMPVFYCPGNHEVDDQRVCTDKDFAVDDSKWSWSIYMQLFRPLYPDQEYGVGGRHWYSADYGDLHISSLNVHRWQSWDGFEYPGWITKDDISPESRQVRWLKDDLSQSTARYKWIIMHWHMLNRGDDGYIPVSNPVADRNNPGKVIYPNGDYCYDVLRPVFEQYKVNAVNYGHSHVYERYLVNGISYIEAASVGNNYRGTGDPYHFTGLRPEIEANDFRTFMLVHVGRDGMTATGMQASLEDNKIGYIGRVIDSFVIAK